jgi:hypothetical protein
VAETEALDERLVGLVVHRREQTSLGGFVARAESLAVAEGSAEPDRKGPDIPTNAQPPAGRRQHEARLAALAGVLDEIGRFLRGTHERVLPAARWGSIGVGNSETMIVKVV